jgi:hypothetical protein
MRCGLILAGLLASVLVVDGAAAAAPEPLIVVTDDTHIPDNPESQTVRFHGGLLTVTLRFGGGRPSMKLVGVDSICSGRRKSFAVSGDYYAYWNNPHGRVLLDRRGKFATGGFSQSLTTEFGAKASNRSLFVDCDRHATTFHISE